MPRRVVDGQSFLAEGGTKSILPEDPGSNPGGALQIKVQNNNGVTRPKV